MSPLGFRQLSCPSGQRLAIHRYFRCCRRLCPSLLVLTMIASRWMREFKLIYTRIVHLVMFRQEVETRRWN